MSSLPFGAYLAMNISFCPADTKISQWASRAWYGVKLGYADKVANYIYNVLIHGHTDIPGDIAGGEGKAAGAL